MKQVIEEVRVTSYYSYSYTVHNHRGSWWRDCVRKGHLEEEDVMRIEVTSRAINKTLKIYRLK